MTALVGRMVAPSARNASLAGGRWRRRPQRSTQCASAAPAAPGFLRSRYYCTYRSAEQPATHRASALTQPRLPLPSQRADALKAVTAFMAPLRGMRAPPRKPTSLQRLALFLAVGFGLGLGLGYIFMGALYCVKLSDRSAAPPSRRRCCSRLRRSSTLLLHSLQAPRTPSFSPAAQHTMGIPSPH